MTIIGLDIGYRNVNITDGKETIIFPSTIALTRSVQVESVPGSASYDILQFGGKSYLVGEAAENHSKFFRATLSRFRTGSEEYKVLFLYALYRLFGKGKQKLQIVTGLPHSDLGDKKEVVKMLQGSHRIKINGKVMAYKVDEVMVIPQPLGTLMGEIFGLENGKLMTVFPDLKHKPCCVVDFGGLTTGFMHFAGAYSTSKSTSIEIGLASYAIRQLQHEIRRKYDAKISLMAADDALRTGTCLISGKPIDISKLSGPILDEIVQHVVSVAHGLWDDAANIEFIFLTGGGTHLLADRFTKAYNRPNIRKVKTPHIANVKGFHLFGLGMREEGKW